VTIWALRRPPKDAGDDDARDGGVPVAYRPSRLSGEAWRSLGWLSVCRPLRLAVLLGECMRLLPRCPRLAFRLLANLHAIAFFARDAGRRQVDLIHGCFLNLPGLVAMGVSIVTGIPFTVAGHARDVFVENGAVPLLARRAGQVIVCHASAADALVRRLNDGSCSKVVVVHHGLDAQCWPSGDATLNRGPACEPVIVAAGRFVPKKGFAGLICACGLLRDRGVRFRLVLIGDGPQADSLRILAEEKGVADRITWPGWLSEPQMRRFLAEGVLVIVPSVIDADGDRDGIPNIVFEAWAVGVPVVASALPTLCEAITHGVHGLLVKPGDEVGLANAVERMLGDAELRQCLTAWGRQRLREAFDSETNGRQLMSLLMRIHHG